MHVELLDYTSGQKQVVAIIRVVGDQPIIEGQVPPLIEEAIHQEMALVKGPKEEAFLKRLPKVFSGSYLRAKFISKD